MKKIEFLWLDIKNFMSIEDSKIIFKPGTTLLLGENKDSIAADDNGAGKSTVAEALRWCLYGETVRGSIDKSLSVDHVCREWSKKKTDVCLQFMYDDLPVFVQRIRTKTKGDLLVQIGTSAVHKNIAAVKALDDILGVNVMQFANLVHLDGSYPYLFAPASDRERKEILADLVDMAITEVMQAEVKTRLGPIEAELGALRDSWTEKGILISHHKNTVDETRTEGMAAKGLLNQLRKEWSSLNIEVSNYTTEKEKLEEENDEQTAKFAVDITAKVAEQCELSSTIELKWKEKSIVSSSYLKSELDVANKALYSKRSNINSIKIRINGIKKLQAEGKCSTCGQDTTEVQTHELESLMSQVKGLDGEVQRDSATLEAIESKKKRKLNILLDEVKTLDKARDRCQCQLEELQRADQVYRGRVLGKLKKVKDLLTLSQDHLTKCNIEITLTKSQQAAYKKEHMKSKELLTSLTKALTEIEERKAYLQAESNKLEFWKTGFGPKGVSSLFIETVLPHISAHIQKYANILTGGDIIVSLQAYKETKSKTIREAIQISAVNSKGASVYGSNSTGERNRINLAVTLGLITYFREANVFDSNLLICDEIFDGLDATGVKQAIQALKEADMSSVLVVSHHSHLKPMFGSTVYVVKEDGISEIVQ